MSAPEDKRESISQYVLQPPYDQALQLGLRQYAEFEKKMSPLFARISSDERDGYLRDIYRLAAEKVLMETGRTDAQNQAQLLAEEAEMFQSATPNIEAASQSLSEAADALPQEFPGRVEVEGIVAQLRDIKQRLTDKAQELARFANVLRNLEGKDIAVRSASPSSLLYEIPLRKMDEVAPDLPSGNPLLQVLP